MGKIFLALSFAWLAAVSAVANPDAKEVFGQGEQLLAEQKWDSAADKFEKAVDLEKNYAEAWNKWGEALYNQSDMFDAIEKFKNAIKINPRYTEALYNLGMGFENINLEKQLKGDDKTKKTLAKTQFQRAIEAYEKALNVTPVNDERSVINLALPPGNSAAGFGTQEGQKGSELQRGHRPP